VCSQPDSLGLGGGSVQCGCGTGAAGGAALVLVVVAVAGWAGSTSSTGLGFVLISGFMFRVSLVPVSVRLLDIFLLMFDFSLLASAGDAPLGFNPQDFRERDQPPPRDDE